MGLYLNSTAQKQEQQFLHLLQTSLLRTETGKCSVRNKAANPHVSHVCVPMNPPITVYIIFQEKKYCLWVDLTQGTIAGSKSARNIFKHYFGMS